MGNAGAVVQNEKLWVLTILEMCGSVLGLELDDQATEQNCRAGLKGVVDNVFSCSGVDLCWSCLG